MFTIITFILGYTVASLCASALICWAVYRFQTRPDPREIDPIDYGDQGGDPLRQFVHASLHTDN